VYRARSSFRRPTSTIPVDDASERRQRAHPRQQRARTEWLAHEVVRPGLERSDEFFLLIEYGQDHDRRVRERPDLTADLNPIRRRHLNVKQHEVRRFAAEKLQCARAVRGAQNVESRATQREAQQRTQVSVVIDDEDSHARSVASNAASRSA
jgi:hypothetical protein